MEEHVRELGAPPADVVRQQLRKLNRGDQRGTEAKAVAENKKAMRKAVKVAETGIAPSAYALPDMSSKGTG